MIVESEVLAFGRKIQAGFSKFLWPSACSVCREPISSEFGLCSGCWNEIKFIQPPVCVCCGLPFEGAFVEQFLAGRDDQEKQSKVKTVHHCAECQRRPPHFASIQAVCWYEDVARSLILGFKHADKLILAPFFARMMTRVGQDLIDESDMIIPVPIARGRLFKRRYNQAAVIAKFIGAQSKGTKAKLAQWGLERIKKTPPQGHLTKVQRLANVKNAFRVHVDWVSEIKGKRILLIDDVVTSGATLNECALILKQAGAVSVSGLIFCRVRK